MLEAPPKLIFLSPPEPLTPFCFAPHAVASVDDDSFNTRVIVGC